MVGYPLLWWIKFSRSAVQLQGVFMVDSFYPLWNLLLRHPSMFTDGEQFAIQEYKRTCGGRVNWRDRVIVLRLIDDFIVTPALERRICGANSGQTIRM